MSVLSLEEIRLYYEAATVAVRAAVLIDAPQPVELVGWDDLDLDTRIGVAASIRAIVERARNIMRAELQAVPNERLCKDWPLLFEGHGERTDESELAAQARAALLDQVP